jgi:hypothetical protein
MGVTSSGRLNACFCALPEQDCPLAVHVDQIKALRTPPARQTSTDRVRLLVEAQGAVFASGASLS